MTASTSTTSIDELPDVVLVDILSRFPDFEFLFKCKPVCKRWCNLISDSYLISCFLFRQLQSGNVQAPPLLTLVNQKGESFPHLPPGPKLLTRLFKRLMSSVPLEKEPIVVGACNDLVLCCASERLQRDYFICNPYTTEWVDLPPPPQVLYDVPVGFICDHPFYNFDHVNAEYRCRVVRIVPCDYDVEETIPVDGGKCRFKVEMFASEVGEWREFFVSFPREFELSSIDCGVHYAHKGMLYWKSRWGGMSVLIGLDPFMLSIETTSTSTSKCYQGCFIYLAAPQGLDLAVGATKTGYSHLHLQCLGGGECLQMCTLDYSASSFLVVWELKEEGDLIMEADGSRKLYPRPNEFLQFQYARQVEIIGFDPNKQGHLYVNFNEVEFVADLDLRSGSRLTVEMIETSLPSNFYFFPLQVKPWWPTPVPRRKLSTQAVNKINVLNKAKYDSVPGMLETVESLVKLMEYGEDDDYDVDDDEFYTLCLHES